MTERRARYSIPASIWLCLTSSILANETVNEVSIVAITQPTPIGPADTFHGYLDYRFHLVNRSGQKEKRITLQLPAVNYGLRDHNIQISRQLVLAPGTAATVSLIQPPVNLLGEDLHVLVDGTGEKLPLSLYDHMPTSHYGSLPIRLMVSKSLGTAFFGQGSAAPTTSTSTGGSTPSTPLGGVVCELAIEQWPTHWLSYSAYDGIVMAAMDLQRIPAGVREALHQYMTAGGALTVIGDWKPPSDWQARRRFAEGIEEHYVGFGLCAVVNVPAIRDIDATAWTAMVKHWAATLRPFQGKHDAARANAVFSVVRDLGIPVTGLLMLMIGFAVVIGPVNLFVLERYRRPMWLLWTVPAISALFCAAIWGYAMTSEGLRGKEKTVGVTILDQRQRRAATIGWTAHYHPLTPGDGLTYSVDTELTPQIDLDRRFQRSGAVSRPRAVDWTSQQQLTTGWVLSRVPAHFLVRKPTTTARERITFLRGSDGRLSIVNGLGADLEKFYYRDTQGQLFHAGVVPTGQSARLLDMPPDDPLLETADPAAFRAMYESDWLFLFQELQRSPLMVQPGTYLAILADQPFIESGLTTGVDREAQAVVIGLTGDLP